MSTYSFLDMSCNLSGPSGSVDLGAGAANSDEGIVIKFGAARNTMKVGADGEFMHSMRAAKHGTCEVNLLKTSPVNAKLSVMFNAQSISSTLWGNNVIVVRNHQSGDVATCRGVAFQKAPDFQNAADGAIVTWVFDCGKIDEILGTYN
jgi:hypothetical protein